MKCGETRKWRTDCVSDIATAVFEGNFGRVLIGAIDLAAVVPLFLPSRALAIKFPARLASIPTWRASYFASCFKFSRAFKAIDLTRPLCLFPPFEYIYMYVYIYILHVPFLFPIRTTVDL